MDDEYFMLRALRLAARAYGRTSPNPLVGAVMVKKGRIIAEDYHRKAGTPHAEALAISSAGDKARGSTLYVTLEPCCHVRKRTPPCTGAIIGSGVGRVVISMLDPNPEVSGKGVEELNKAGVGVSVGLLKDRARKLNRAYIKYITTKTPYVILKTAMTLDGKIAAPTGESKWITGDAARRAVHRLRCGVDAILTAIGTVKADDPELTARLRGCRSPLRVLIDPYLDVPLSARILKTPPQTVIVTKTSGNKIDKLIKTGITVLNYKERLELNWLLRRLGEMGVTSVLIEGGSSINAHALNEGIVDRVMFFIAPKILGGKKSYPSVGGTLERSLGDVLKVTDMQVRRIGGDILVEGDVKQPAIL